MTELVPVSDAEEEFLSESKGGDGKVRTAATTAKGVEQTSALIVAEVSDMMGIGCSCQGTNQYAALDEDCLQSLMTSLRKLDKKSLKLYILCE